MSMADRIAVLREGAIQQIDTPEKIYNEPANRFVATVVGSPPMNFIPAEASFANGSLRVVHDTFEVTAPSAGVAQEAAGACWVGIRPEDVRVERGGDGIAASVYVTEPLGGETVVDLRVADRVVKALVSPTLQLETDQKVSVTLDPKRLHVFAEAGQALLSAAGSDLFQVRLKRG